MIEIDKQLFVQQWQELNTNNLTNMRDFWDLRASEFNKKVNKKNNTAELTQYLLSKGALHKNANILDIGCGAGKYIIPFAKMARSVTGLDISPNMIEFAAENAKKEQLQNVQLKVLPWQQLEVAQKGWENRFDLVFASMSPAVNSAETLQKMTEASKKHCFLSGFVYRKDSVKDELVKQLTGKESNDYHHKKIYHAFNILWHEGIYPEVSYKDASWTRQLPVEEAKKIYTMSLQNMAILEDQNEELEEKVATFIDNKSRNGYLEETIESKIAWLFWEK